MKSSIQNAQCLLSNMVVAQSWFGTVSVVEGLENCVFLIVSWIDSTTETFWNKIFYHQSTILNSGNNTTSYMIMIINIPLG